MLRHVLITTAVLVIGQREAAAQQQADSIDHYIRAAMAERRIPAAVVAVIQNGRVTFEKAYGTENLETETPASKSTAFELASVTKQFTAAAIMLLVQDGRVKLDEAVSTYIDDAPPAWNAITIRQLLTHTSGMPINAIVGHDGSPLLNIRTRQVFEMLSHEPLDAAPGTRFAYSDAGYFLLGMVVESASGMPYREFMQRRILEPARMTASSVLDRRRILKHRASVYTLRDGQLLNWRRDWDYELPSFFGVISTIGDLVKWDAVLRANWLLADSTLAEMWRPAPLANGATVEPAYGFGWYLAEAGGHHIAEHPGASGTFLLHVIDRPLTIIVLTNLDGASGPSGAILAHHIATIIDPALLLLPR